LKNEQKKTRKAFDLPGLQKRAGIVLLSHTLVRALPSPLAGLTSEFGMGSGVAPPLKTPAKLFKKRSTKN
jgi:hypothetical protein